VGAGEDPNTQHLAPPLGLEHACKGDAYSSRGSRRKTSGSAVSVRTVHINTTLIINAAPVSKLW